jgi:hypothetical protein
LIILLLALGTYPSIGQITINEACSSNGNVLEDLDGSTPDWIELYNSSDSEVSLDGWFLSDDFDQPNLWSFVGTNIPAYGFRIVFCSGDAQNLAEPHSNFKLSKNGEDLILSRPDGTVEDSVTFGFIPSNQSLGRQTDGSAPFVYYQSPTPRTTNNTVEGTASYKTAIPSFSQASGFYSSQIEISLSCATPNSWISFTTDGSTPKLSSQLYSNPIVVSSSKVIRAVAYSDAFFPSNPAGGCFFIEDQADIPVVSISTDPGYLFDEDTGIYMMGPHASADFPYLGANFWSDTEIPVYVHFFEEDGSLAFEQEIGLEMHGGSISRTMPMRSLRLIAKSSYGKNRVRHELFPSKGITDYKRFLLRNSGSDYLQLGFRDGFINEHLISRDINIDLGAYRPSRVYINGEYWGMHNLREKLDRYYVEDNHNVDDKNLDLLEEQNEVIEGDFVAFDSMEQFILTHDLSEESNMAIASSYFDTDNLVDYYACQTILNNADWPYNNLKFWRERRIGGKWRYIIFDLDVILGGVPFIPVEFENLGRIMGDYGDGNRHVEIFRKFLQDEEFKRYFINRNNDLLNTTFLPEALTVSLEKANEMVKNELPIHWTRWNGNEGDFNTAYDTAVAHINGRPQHARNDVKKVFDLGDEQVLSFNVFPSGSGTIQLNSLRLNTFPWTGIYHNGNEVDVQAEPTDGSTFSHWELNGIEVSNDKVRSLRFNPENDAELVAVFDATFLGIDLEVYPDPANTDINISLEVPNAGPLTISIINMEGKEVLRLCDKSVLSGRLIEQFSLSSLEQGTYLVRAKGEDFGSSVKILIIQN